MSTSLNAVRRAVAMTFGGEIYDAPSRESPVGLWRLTRSLQRVSVFVILVVLWQIVVWTIRPPAYLLPAPGDVWRAIWNPALHWPESIAITVKEILGGFAISTVTGFGLGIVIAWTPFLERTFLPFLV